MKTVSILIRLFATMTLTVAACCSCKTNNLQEGNGDENVFSSPALNFLLNEIGMENRKRVVFRDFCDGATLYTQRAMTNSAGEKPVMDETAPSPYGVSCIHINYRLKPEDWNGFMFITGKLDAGSAKPALDFGDRQTGYDLSGATKLTFKARGITGGERIKFYCGGLGNGTSAKYPDSSQSFLTDRDNGFISLTKEWKEYSIDLKGKNLSRIACGFAWVTSKEANPNMDRIEFELDDIEYCFDSELFTPLFLRSYKPLALTDNRSFINNFSYTYDNAVLAILLAKSGKIQYARQIADALAYCVQHDRYYKSGAIRNAYANGMPASFPGWLSPRGEEFAMLPGFYLIEKDLWAEDRYAVGINTGVCAWALEALLTVYDAYPSDSYLNAAITLADCIIDNFKANDATGGFTGGLEGWEGNTEKLTYKSVEHNIDMVSACRHLYVIMSKIAPEKADRYLAAATYSRDFVLKMYDKGCFYTGTKADGITPSTDNKPLDANTWAILALHGDREIGDRWNPENVYAFIQQTFRVGEGYDYNQDLDAEWREGECHLALAALQLGKQSEYERIIRHLNSVAEPDGSICSASKDGLTTGFESMIAVEGGGLAAIPWTYDRRVSLASTAWLALAQIGLNPYYNE
ncbi:MAG: hypothetical protein LBG92_02635 [Prevotellaceae bacterium]|jgi:hypothetical protein|nr:hypothetical protein [Prevotellaceae bacterium]